MGGGLRLAKGPEVSWPARPGLRLHWAGRCCPSHGPGGKDPLRRSVPDVPQGPRCPAVGVAPVHQLPGGRCSWSPLGWWIPSKSFFLRSSGVWVHPEPCRGCEVPGTSDSRKSQRGLPFRALRIPESALMPAFLGLWPETVGPRVRSRAFTQWSGLPRPPVPVGDNGPAKTGPGSRSGVDRFSIPTLGLGPVDIAGAGDQSDAKLEVIPISGKSFPIWREKVRMRGNGSVPSPNPFTWRDSSRVGVLR